jgi:hypothetical protein
MNAIKSLATRGYSNLVEAITTCDGRLCEDIGMALVGVMTVVIMFSAIGQMA